MFGSWKDARKKKSTVIGETVIDRGATCPGADGHTSGALQGEQDHPDACKESSRWRGWHMQRPWGSELG